MCGSGWPARFMALPTHELAWNQVLISYWSVVALSCIMTFRIEFAMTWVRDGRGSVTAEYLKKQGLGDAFVEYRSSWAGFVESSAAQP